MRTKVVVAAAALLLAFSACATDEPDDVDEAAPSPTATAAAEVHWTYTGDRGPENWGELTDEFEACAEGDEQSPIDVVEVEPDTETLGFDYEASSGTILNNGHTIQVKPSDGGSITVNDERFDLVQFHFHAPAEHKLEGATHALEIHLVHQNDDDELAVVGAFIKPGASNEALDPFWNDLPEDADEEVDLPDDVDPADLLPLDRDAMYLYDGSLTTPPCSEGVQWILLPEAVEMSEDQIDMFRDLYDNNARPVQPLNDREVTEADTGN